MSPEPVTVMTDSDYLRLLVEVIHSAVIATNGSDGHPQTRVIDMMLWDEGGVYFLTARGKTFHSQLMEQRYIALSATKGGKSVSLRGRIRNIGSERLDEIFEKNCYMKAIYPGDTRSALDVFCLYEAEGEFFDISNPSAVERDTIAIGRKKPADSGYFAGDGCTGCRMCFSVCPQKCIDVSKKPVKIDRHHCLGCGRCAEVCPVHVIEKRL